LKRGFFVNFEKIWKNSVTFLRRLRLLIQKQLIIGRYSGAGFKEALGKK
jgi:hypothetical protein